MDTTLTYPSRPGCSSMTRAKCHLRGGRLSSLTITKSSIAIWAHPDVHIPRICNWGKYSICHRFQKVWRRCCPNFQRRIICGSSPFKSGSGTEVTGAPSRKCAGVSGMKSLGSLLIGVNGRELRQASIWYSSVLSSLSVSFVSTVVLAKLCLALLTAASHNPPKWGVDGGLKRQVIPSLANCLSRCWV